MSKMNEIRIYKIVMVAVLLGTASVSLGAGDTWTQKADMPKARFILSASAVDGKIYSIGGSSAMHGEGLSIVDEYDPTTDTWTTKAPMPTPRQWLSTSVVNGKIYAIGGDARAGAPSLSTVEVYDPATDTWTEKAPMLIPRFGLSTSVVDGKIYAMGGWRRPPLSLPHDLEEYDPATDTWTKKAPMPTARAALSTNVVDGKIYAIGGALSGGGAGLSTVEAYDPATDTWTTKAPMPTARSIFLSGSAVNGIIYVIGGASGELAFSTVEAYDPATDTWTEKTSMPKARTGLATSVVGGKIYAFGGTPSTHGAPMSTVYEYDATPPLVVDFNGDGIVNFKDLCMLTQYWHQEESPFANHSVDYEYLAVLAEYWLTDFRLIAHWKLDETEGAIAYDSIRSNDGTLNGDPNWQPTAGKVDGALKFNSIDNYVSAGFVLTPADLSLSAFAWVKGGAPGQVIISQADRRVGRFIEPGSTWLGIDPADGRLITKLLDPLFPPLESDSVITDGQWHHVGLVYDFYGFHRRLYVDGAEVAKDTDVVAGLLSDSELYFGAGQSLDAASFFSGLIDDVRIYNQALSAEEIEEMVR
jgi:N-acetylneuraminic acid mutarotase